MPRKPAFISHSRAREVQIQHRLLAVLEGRFRRFLRAEIKRESDRLADGYAETGLIPPPDEVHRQRIGAIYYQMDLASIRAFGSRVLGQGKAAGVDLETKATFREVFEAMASAFVNLESVRRRIASVSETTRNDVIRAIEKGNADGLGVDGIAALIREMSGVKSKLRSHIIARTETHAAANYGAHEAAKQTGLTLKKEWVSADDHRTRDFGEGDGVVDEFDHRSMNGQAVGLDDPFTMPRRNGTFVQCQYPGDPSLPPGGSINCRCASVHIVQE